MRWLLNVKWIVPIVIMSVLPEKGATTNEDSFYCNPKLPPPTGDGTTTKVSTSGKIISDNQVTVDTVRWLLGCNEPRSSFLTYRWLQSYYKAATAPIVEKYERERLKRRGAQFCVTEDQFQNTKLERFTNIFKDIRQKGQPGELLSIWDPQDRSKSFGLKRLSFIRIETPEKIIPYLRQWFHIKMIFEEPMEGLFIQPISGPIGVPFGEFRIDFNCKDVLDDYNKVMNFKTYYEDPGIIPCKYRPRSSLRHPHVFVFGGKIKNPPIKARKEFHVHFNWIDAQCAGPAMIQFLFIAVKKFSSMDYNVFNSPTYEHSDFDSEDATPYPYYFPWGDDIKCDGQEMDPWKLKSLQTFWPTNSYHIKKPSELDLHEDEHNHPSVDSESDKIDILPLLETKPFLASSLAGSNNSAYNVNLFHNGGLRKMSNVIRSKRAIVNNCDNKDTCIMAQFIANRKTHIVYNQEYDDCITGKSSPKLERGKTCPPGPFKCSKDTNNKAERVKNRQEIIDLSEPCTVCKFPDDRPIFHNRNLPEDTESTEFPLVIPTTLPPPADASDLPLIDVTKSFQKILEMNFRSDRRFHGSIMILCWLVIIPGANFISRFYKETGGSNGKAWFIFFGLSPWASGHIVLMYTSLLLMWIGLLFMAGYPSTGTVDCSKLPNDQEDNLTCKRYQWRALGHISIGGAAFFLFHVQLIDGWIRPKNAAKRTYVLLWHCISGYLTYILAGISAMIGPNCSETIVLIFFLLVSSGGMFGVGTFAQKVQDKQLQLIFKRKWFPVLEGLEIRENPPLGKTKLLILLGHWLIHVFLLLLVVFSYISASSNDNPNPNLKSSTYQFGGWSDKSCTALNADYLHQRVWCYVGDMDGCAKIR